MFVYDYLKDSKESIPTWLKEYKNGDKISFNEILKSRIVYYPGAGYDGQAVRTFNKSHYAHTYIYVDYGIEARYCQHDAKVPHAFKGYHIIAVERLKMEDLTPNSWIPHFHLNDSQKENLKHFATAIPYAFLFVYDRDEEYGDEHGCERFALIYIGGDGIATYDALFINNHTAPSAIVIQDHGFGCNYDRFGHGGILENLVKKFHCYPEYAMCVKDNYGQEIWDGYEMVEGVLPELGSGKFRYLYKRKNNLGGKYGNQ